MTRFFITIHAGSGAGKIGELTREATKEEVDLLLAWCLPCNHDLSLQEAIWKEPPPIVPRGTIQPAPPEGTKKTSLLQESASSQAPPVDVPRGTIEPAPSCEPPAASDEPPQPMIDRFLVRPMERPWHPLHNGIAALVDCRPLRDRECQKEKGKPLCAVHGLPLTPDRCKVEFSREQRCAAIDAWNKEREEKRGNFNSKAAALVTLVMTARTAFELSQSVGIVNRFYGDNPIPKTVTNAIATQRRRKLEDWEEMISNCTLFEWPRLKEAQEVQQRAELLEAIHLREIDMREEFEIGGIFGPVPSEEEQRQRWQQIHWQHWINFGRDEARHKIFQAAMQLSREWGYRLGFEDDQIDRIEQDAEEHLKAQRFERDAPIDVSTGDES